MSTARINRKFLPGAREAANVSVLAVASRSEQAADAYAREQGIPRAYASYEALLADPDVEAVYIPLPNALHVEWATKALEAGKHVLCEKPLSRRAADVERAFDVAEREGRLLMEGFMYRHNPQTHRLAQLLADGAIGPLRMIRTAFSFPLPGGPNVRLDQALDGGALMDVGCYCVNAARLFAGSEPLHVAGAQVRGGDGVDVAFAGTLAFDDGVLAHFDAGIDMAPRSALEIVGESGMLFTGDPWHCDTPVIEVRRAGEPPERIELQRINSYRLEAENFSAAIQGEAAPLLGREDALGQAHAIEALYAAAADVNGRVAWRPRETGPTDAGAAGVGGT
jgi:predicted dehydrogenase